MIRVRVWVNGLPKGGNPITVTIPAIPCRGDLLSMPAFAAARVLDVKWDINPDRDPVLIVDVITS
jgi:hypothetical protein